MAQLPLNCARVYNRLLAAPTMTVGRLLFAGVTTAYILVAVKFLEERDLKKMLGKEYENYQKEIPIIFPISKIR